MEGISNSDLRAMIRYTWKARHRPQSRMYVRWLIRELKRVEASRPHGVGTS